ncbi:hypothetical protein MASR1M107_08090 [Ignavibacteriales bacterium]
MNRLEQNFHKYLPLNRKEKFYTATVLPQIICSDNFRNFRLFLELIPNIPSKLVVLPDAVTNNILFLTEYSLKESLVEDHHKSVFSGNYETKDTPDLVILITEPSPVLIVIEAKMFSSAASSDINQQLGKQKWVVNELAKVHEIPADRIFHLALIPQQMVPNKSSITEDVIYWEEVVQIYEEKLKGNYFLETLRIALRKYNLLKSQSGAGGLTYRKNMDEMIPGSTIVKLYENGKRFVVGRSGGLNGDKFRADIASGGWKTFEYEVKHDTETPMNRNWFTSGDFYDRVKNAIRTTNREVSHNLDSDKNLAVRESESVPVKVMRKADHPWHFSHLGEGYFKDVAQILGFGRTLDAPIRLIYVGKSGVPYSEKKRGRMVNPNWAVLQEDGQEFKYKQNKNDFVQSGLWNTSNCNCFYWEEIRKFFTGK